MRMVVASPVQSKANDSRHNMSPGSEKGYLLDNLELTDKEVSEFLDSFNIEGFKATVLYRRVTSFVSGFLSIVLPQVLPM